MRQHVDSLAHSLTRVNRFVALLHSISMAAALDFKGRVVWRYVYYGIVTFLALESLTVSINDVDDLRYVNTLSPTKDQKTLFGGMIIAYSGLLLCFKSIVGKLKFRLNVPFFLWLVAVALAVVGFIILWALDGMQHGSPFSGNVRPIVFNTTISIILANLFLWGGIMFEFADGAYAASIVLGLYCIWILSNGFTLKDALVSDRYAVTSILIMYL